MDEPSIELELKSRTGLISHFGTLLNPLFISLGIPDGEKKVTDLANLKN